MKIKLKLSKNKKRIILMCLGVLALISGFICYIYFDAENIQRRIKEKICAKVIERETELLEIVKECPKDVMLIDSRVENEADDNQNKPISCDYKELNNEKISRTFRDFNLIVISGRHTEGSVYFCGRPTIVKSILWDGYGCGFYYSENDKPVDVIWSSHEIDESETEYVNNLVGYKEYWYRTEKITDNWWFYETKTVSGYPTYSLAVNIFFTGSLLGLIVLMLCIWVVMKP